MMLNEILKFFAQYIETELGIVYNEHNFFQLQNRLEEIVKLTHFPSLEALYKEQSQQGISGSFKQLLLDTATNNETSFFRDPKAFQAIEENILKEYSRLFGSGEKLRIWSAASSTGQEALSLAMLIQEFNQKTSEPISFSILATDISERVLEKAKKATYTQLEVQRGLPTALLNKYFQQKEPGYWTASADLTNQIEFKKANLRGAFSHLGGFHLILCRNVLIYQNIEGKKEIVQRILGQIEPGGILVLGGGETLLGISDDFDQLPCEGTIFYRKKSVLAAAS